MSLGLEQLERQGRESDVEISAEYADKDMLLLRKGESECFHPLPHWPIPNYH